jgi:CHAT domain-containing protein
MQKFYELWLNGMSKHDAFEQAIKEVRKVYKSPYYWAPFVLLDAI